MQFNSRNYPIKIIVLLYDPQVIHFWLYPQEIKLTYKRYITAIYCSITHKALTHSQRCKQPRWTKKILHIHAHTEKYLAKRIKSCLLQQDETGIPHHVYQTRNRKMSVIWHLFYDLWFLNVFKKSVENKRATILGDWKVCWDKGGDVGHGEGRRRVDGYDQCTQCACIKMSNKNNKVIKIIREKGTQRERVHMHMSPDLCISAPGFPPYITWTHVKRLCLANRRSNDIKLSYWSTFISVSTSNKHTTGQNVHLLICPFNKNVLFIWLLPVGGATMNKGWCLL